jgi:hypothetical protein
MGAAVAQHHPEHDGKVTSLVVVQYEQFIADGSLLTPEGWKRAATLFGQSKPYPANGIVVLRSTGGTLGETWRKENQAEVQTKWTDSFGSIDSKLRYKPATRDRDVIGLIDIFHLVFDGWKWRIDGPMGERTTTLDRAVRYIREMRERSNDVVIKKNAGRTIAILMKLRSECGSATAC